MKYLFLCGSLEPGKNGVGDYTRRLGGALIREGYDVKILSLFDQNAAKITNETQLIEETSVHVLRIPKGYSFISRLEKTKQLIREFNPHWISLQYVPNAFNSNGIPLWLPFFLKKIKANYKTQVMFHELAYPSTTLSYKIIRFIQFKIIKYIQLYFSPNVIHTHTPYYIATLKKYKIEARPLPLFSNIPKVNFKLLKKDKNCFKLGLFGQIKTTKKIIKIVEHISKVLDIEKKIFEIVLLGAKINDAEKFENDIKSNEINAKVIIKGFLKDFEISKELQKLDLGMSAVPQHAHGKSGSLAAFFEHDLNVILPEKSNLSKKK